MINEQQHSEDRRVGERNRQDQSEHWDETEDAERGIEIIQRLNRRIRRRTTAEIESEGKWGLLSGIDERGREWRIGNGLIWIDWQDQIGSIDSSVEVDQILQGC